MPEDCQMPKKDYSSSELALALKLFEAFDGLDEIPNEKDLATVVGIGEKHPLYQKLNGKQFSAELKRAEVQAILEQRKQRRPAKLDATEIKGKKGYLLGEDDRYSVVELFKRFPGLMIIPKGTTIGEVLQNILSDAELAELDDATRAIRFDKTVLRDGGGNIYAASDSVLGKGAFGEVCYAQVIAAGDGQENLRVGQYTAMKRQAKTEDNVEDIKQEFAMEREQENYHYGALESETDIYSFIRLVSGGEVHEWVKRDILKQQKAAKPATDSLDDMSADDFAFLFDHEAWELKKEAELEALQDLDALRREVDALKEKARAYEAFSSRLVELNETDEYLQLADDMEAAGLISFKRTQDEDGDWEIEIIMDSEVEALDAKFAKLRRKEFIDELGKKFPYTQLDDFGEQLARIQGDFNANVYGKVYTLANDIKTRVEPSWGTSPGFGTEVNSIDDEAKHEGKDKKLSATEIKLEDYPPDILMGNPSADFTLDISRLLRMCEGLAQRVDEAHQQGILHRDLKGENVLVDPETNEPILIDWGIAVKLDDDGKCTTQTAGSPGHWPPEAYQNDEATHTTAFDMYALGATYQDMIKLLLREYISEDNHNRIMGLFPEMIMVKRMRNIRIENPDGDPKVEAINDLLQVIDDLVKVKPEDRANCAHVIAKLHDARVKLDAALEIEDPLRENMQKCLENIKFSGKLKIDEWKAREAFEEWNKTHPAGEQITFNKRIVYQVINQVMVEQKDREELHAQQEAQHQAQIEQQDRVQKWSVGYEQRQYEGNLTERDFLKTEIQTITALKESLSADDVTFAALRQMQTELQSIGLLKVEEDRLARILKTPDDDTEVSPQQIESFHQALKEIADDLQGRKTVNLTQVNRQIERFEDKHREVTPVPTINQVETRPRSASAPAILAEPPKAKETRKAPLISSGTPSAKERLAEHPNKELLDSLQKQLKSYIDEIMSEISNQTSAVTFLKQRAGGINKTEKEKIAIQLMNSLNNIETQNGDLDDIRAALEAAQISNQAIHKGKVSRHDKSRLGKICAEGLKQIRPEREHIQHKRLE